MERLNYIQGENSHIYVCFNISRMMFGCFVLENLSNAIGELRFNIMYRYHF